MDLLDGAENASDKFCKLEERIKKDKKHPGVLLELSKGNVEEYNPDQEERIVNPPFITEEMATHSFA